MSPSADPSAAPPGPPSLSPSISTSPVVPIVFQAARDRGPLGWIALAVGLIASSYVAASAWERVRTRPADRSIEVTGSAKRQIKSDLAQWSATIATEDKDRTVAYRALHTQVDAARAYLVGLGFADDEIHNTAATFSERTDTEVTGVGDNRVEKTIFLGYHVEGGLTVSSAKVAKVEQASREITALLEQGIDVSSSAPSYFYTKLGELKIEMLAEASKDARTRAEKMIGSAGGAGLGKLVTADMGVINVNPANQTSTTWDGNNDTTSLDKDILTIVHATYDLR